MADKKENGYWFSLENGTHIFVPNGKTPEQATKEYLSKVGKTEYKDLSNPDDFDNDYEWEENDDWSKFTNATDKKVTEYGWTPDGFDGDTRFYNTEDSWEGLSGASVRPDGRTTLYTENGSIGFNSLKNAVDFLNLKDKEEAENFAFDTNSGISVRESDAIDDLFKDRKSGNEGNQNSDPLEQTFLNASYNSDKQEYEKLINKGLSSEDALKKMFDRHYGPSEDDLDYESKEFIDKKYDELKAKKQDFMNKYNAEKKSGNKIDKEPEYDLERDAELLKKNPILKAYYEPDHYNKIQEYMKEHPSNEIAVNQEGDTAKELADYRKSQEKPVSKKDMEELDKFTDDLYGKDVKEKINEKSVLDQIKERQKKERNADPKITAQSLKYLREPTTSVEGQEYLIKQVQKDPALRSRVYKKLKELTKGSSLQKDDLDDADYLFSTNWVGNNYWMLDTLARDNIIDAISEVMTGKNKEGHRQDLKTESIAKKKETLNFNYDDMVSHAKSNGMSMEDVIELIKDSWNKKTMGK